MSDGVRRVQEVIDTLLGPGGCPWDQKQTVESLCDYVVEEAYELVQAVRGGDAREAAEELGDVAFLLLFIARLYEKQGQFDLDQALQANAAKMIRRHPHVFGETCFENQEELLRNWERIKRAEKEENGAKGLLQSLPKGLPPLLKAYRLHSKVARIDFTWESDAQLEEQLHGEWQELQQALQAGGEEALAAVEHEYGDYLFTLVEWGRRKGLKANAALDKTNLRFVSRFERMEALAAERGQDLAALPLAEKNALWDEVKQAETQ